MTDCLPNLATLTKLGHSLYSPYELAALRIFPNIELSLLAPLELVVGGVSSEVGVVSSAGGDVGPRYFCASLLST